MNKIITTSWDDGHPLDFKIAERLEFYGLKGTFYIPQTNSEHEVMTETEIVSLSKKYDIGGHTLNHVGLNHKNQAKLENEIIGCRLWLERLLNKTCISFCYPKGLYSSLAIETVKKAGFKYARTVELCSITPIINPLLVPTSLQVYPHTTFTYFKSSIKRSGLQGFQNVIINGGLKNAKLSYLTHKMLDRIETHGGIFHLWGHSWEIEQEGLWSQLEELFQICALRNSFEKKTNSQLIEQT